MSQRGKRENIQIMPEHCGGDPGGGAAMRAACDAFFARRGLNVYGGTKVIVPGLAGMIGASARRGLGRKGKREEKKVSSDQ